MFQPSNPNYFAPLTPLECADDSFLSDLFPSALTETPQLTSDAFDSLAATTPNEAASMHLDLDQIFSTIIKNDTLPPTPYTTSGVPIDFAPSSSCCALNAITPELSYSHGSICGSASSSGPSCGNQFGSEATSSPTDSAPHVFFERADANVNFLDDVNNNCNYTAVSAQSSSIMQHPVRMENNNTNMTYAPPPAQSIIPLHDIESAPSIPVQWNPSVNTNNVLVSGEEIGTKPPYNTQLPVFVKGSPCSICGDLAHGNHYGAISCQGCKAFFRRMINKPMRLLCLRNGDCVITKKSRVNCPACRLNKCYAMGMNRMNNIKSIFTQISNSKATSEKSEDEDTPDVQEMYSKLVASKIKTEFYLKNKALNKLEDLSSDILGKLASSEQHRKDDELVCSLILRYEEELKYTSYECQVYASTSKFGKAKYKQMQRSHNESDEDLAEFISKSCINRAELLLQFRIAHSFPAFVSLPTCDQQVLLRNCTLEMMFFRLLRGFRPMQVVQDVQKQVMLKNSEFLRFSESIPGVFLTPWADGVLELKHLLASGLLPYDGTCPPHMISEAADLDATTLAMCDRFFKLAQRICNMSMKKWEVCLLMAVMLFTPEREGLLNVDIVREEQESWGELLRRRIEFNAVRAPGWGHNTLNRYAHLMGLLPLIREFAENCRLSIVHDFCAQD